MGGDQARCLWWQDEPVVVRTLAFVFVRQVGSSNLSGLEVSAGAAGGGAAYA